MAFTSEVTAKLNLDKSGFDRTMTQVVASVGKAGAEINARLEKAFSFKDVFKGLMQGIGIGSVQQIIGTVTGYFESQARSAQTLEERTGKAVDAQREYALSVASVADRYKILRKQVQDLNVDIEMQQKLVNDLRSNPLTFINESSRKELEAAEKKLGELQDKRDAVLLQIDREKDANKRATAEWIRGENNKEELRDAELKDASELKKKQIEINQLVKEYNRLKREGRLGGEEDRRNLTAQWKLYHDIAMIQKAAQKELAAAEVTIGREGVTGKAKPPRPRGRTETERIADRAAENEMRMRDAIMKGDKKAAGRYAERAAEDYGKAGRRIAEASSGVKKETSESLGGQLVKANTTLEAIKANLDPAKIR